uniref:Uncharacterized protein n=1 Tax=Clastoptera arizonana TaxID=38151 RepID=A0A1B6CZD1_9HEMI
MSSYSTAIQIVKKNITTDNMQISINDNLVSDKVTENNYSNKIKVLDEDTYLENVGKIIERDFFPDLKKLRAQNDYLDALERNDMVKVRELYAKYNKKVPFSQDGYASPATFETPISNKSKDDEICDNNFLENTPNNSKDLCNEENSELKLSLDQYLGSHTSEDNNSFQEIIKESEQQHRHKHSWLYEGEESSNLTKGQSLILPSIEEQANCIERPLNIETWNYRNKNYIMYVPDGIQLTQNEEIEQARSRQEISHNNTRLEKCPFDENQNKETIQGLAISQSRIMEGKIGVDGKELTFGDTPRINGFSFVKTPSPAPGVNESPLMTWGNLEGTPFRLDGGDTPLRATPGPCFKIPEPPKREKLALALAEKAGERHRDRKKKAILAAQRQFNTPSPKNSIGSPLERIQSMSPAAQRLASSQIRRLNSDKALQASYSPARSSPAYSSPLSLTPILASSPKTQPNRILTPKRSSNPNITDNLLKLNLPKRPKAADFF